MASFLGSLIKNTYKQILQIGSGNSGVSTSLQTVQDGNGTNTALQLSTTAVKVNGTIEVAGNTTLDGTLAVGNSTVTGTAHVTGNTTIDGTLTVGGHLVTTGSAVIVQQVHTRDATYSNASTTIPYDDTIPQNTEGTEIITLSITPTSATNVLRIQATIHMTVTIAGKAIIALFQDTTANALNAIAFAGNATDGPDPIIIDYWMVAGTTSSTTFKIRAGSNGGNPFYINGYSGSRLFGGVSYSTLSIVEYTP